MTSIGIVDSVTVDETNSRIWVSVFLSPGRESVELPFLTPAEGFWIVPEKGQAVEVYSVGPGRKAARFPHSNPDYDMPTGLGPGDVALTLNSGTELLFTKQSDGTFNVALNADGDINLSASGNITIDEGGTAKAVLTEDAKFEYEDELSDGTTTTKTTTKVSNGEKTTTEVE